LCAIERYSSDRQLRKASFSMKLMLFESKLANSSEPKMKEKFVFFLFAELLFLVWIEFKPHILV
jgi:hypothetical protein